MPDVLGDLPKLASRSRSRTPDVDAAPATPRAATGAASELQHTAAVTDGATSAEQLQTLVADYFRPHKTPENADQINALVTDRTNQLLAMGETAKSVGDVFAKANRMDRVSQAASGFLASVPFGAATLVLDAAPVLTGFATTPFQSGTAGGVISHVFDAAGGKLLEKAVSDTQWLDGHADKLAPVMADAKKASAPGTLQSHTEQAVGIQTFTARNIARTLANTVLTAKSTPQTAAKVDLWMAGAGSPVAGAAYNLAMHHTAQKNHRVGPEFLLGREDWAERFNDLKAATWKGAMANGAGRLARIPFDAATSAAGAAQSLFTPANLAKGTALGVGFGAVDVAVTAAAEAAAKHHVSAAGTAAITQGVQTLASAGVFPLWTSASLATAGLASKAGAAVDVAGNAVGSGVAIAANATLHGVGRAGSAVVQGMSAVADSASRRAGGAADSTTQTLGDAARGLRRRFPAAASATAQPELDLEARGDQYPPRAGEVV